MPKWVEKILKSNLGEKSLKSTICNLSSFRMFIKKKVQSCHNYPEKSYTEKKARHEPSDWAMFTRCSFDEKKKLNYYRGKDHVKI